MAEFVRDDVEEAVLVIDDLFCELDGGVVFVRQLHGSIQVSGFGGFLSPICAAGCGVEGFAPDDVDTACGGRELADLVLSHGVV
jgi:hypothetical protein